MLLKAPLRGPVWDETAVHLHTRTNWAPLNPSARHVTKTTSACRDYSREENARKHSSIIAVETACQNRPGSASSFAPRSRSSTFRRTPPAGTAFSRLMFIGWHLCYIFSSIWHKCQWEAFPTLYAESDYHKNCVLPAVFVSIGLKMFCCFFLSQPPPPLARKRT